MCHAKKKKKKNQICSNYSTLHSHRHMLPHCVITVGDKWKTFTGPDLASFLPAFLLPQHTSLVKPLRRTYGIRSEEMKEMNFISPFSLPLLIERGTELTLCDSCSLTKRGRENEFYSLWSYQTAAPSRIPSEVAYPTTLPFSYYLTKDLKWIWLSMPFLLSPALSHSHPSRLPLLSFPFAALNKEKINFTVPHKLAHFKSLLVLPFLVVASAKILQPHSPSATGAAHFIPSASAVLHPLWKPRSALAYRWCLLCRSEAHFCSVYCPCVLFERPPVGVLWKGWGY